MVALILILPGVAGAHARLVRSWPANGAAVALSPGELRLCFNELLERQFHAIELEVEDGAAVGFSRRPVQLAPAVDARDDTCLLATLPSLPPASYVVHWRVVSRDGHATRGLIRFRVG
jgi:methionine-rich copper-binding protein CopC